jgi:Rieske Fe-S protein
VNEQDETPTRRSALALVLGGVSALAAGALGLAGAFLSNTFGRSRERPWIQAGFAHEVAADFRRYVLSAENRHAWVTDRRAVVAWIRASSGGELVALSAACPHLGCSVAWVAERERFQCPCHDGVFDATGTVVHGPPPTGLARMEVKVEGEVLFVRAPEDRA